eukprot:c9369_g1_i2 orf=303-2060(-)
MATNCSSGSFSLSTSTIIRKPPRFILLFRSKTLTKENVQGLPRIRDNGIVHVLGKISYKLGRTSTFRRLYVRCSLNHGPESEGVVRKYSGEIHRKPQRSLAMFTQSAASFTKTFVIYGIKVFFSVTVLLSLAIAGAPAVLSSRLGCCTMVGLVNKAIPGHAAVQHLSLGWSKPICVEGVSLKGIDGKTVMSILKLETQASLWSIVRGKAGLGDCSIVCPKIDLQEDTKSGLLKMALALFPASKLSLAASQAKASPMFVARRTLPSMDIAFTAMVKALGGGLKVIDGKLTVRDDVAATLGQRVFIDVLLGQWAVEDDDNLRQAYDRHLDLVPLKAGMWSEGTKAEATGFIHVKKKLINLIQPVKVEMDLSPAVAHLYLARINPLLGELIGPAVQDEDMPDVVLNVSPENLMLPAKHFKVALEPMKAVLARGPLAGGMLGLLSTGKEDIAKGKKEVSVQTSRIESQVGMDGSVECSRIDFLIAGKVAMATWGTMNWRNETLKMIIAVPSTTIGNLFRLKLSEGYYLKIPVGGTLEHPHVDWKASAIGVAQLSLKQRGGKFFKELISLFDSEAAVPDPIEVIPWIPKS